MVRPRADPTDKHGSRSSTSSRSTTDRTRQPTASGQRHDVGHDNRRSMVIGQQSAFPLPPSAFRRPRFAIRYRLSTVGCTLAAVRLIRYTLSAVRCPPFACHWPPSSVHCLLSNVQYPLSNVHCQGEGRVLAAIPFSSDSAVTPIAG